MTKAKFSKWRALSLKINNDEIGEMREKVRYIYIYIYRKKNARETKQCPCSETRPTSLCHVFWHLILDAQGIINKYPLPFSFKNLKKKKKKKAYKSNSITCKLKLTRPWSRG